MCTGVLGTCHTSQEKEPSAPSSNQLQKPRWRDCGQTRGPAWDTLPHTSQFLPRFVVSLTAANILAQAAVHRRVETSNCSALRDLGIPRGYVCSCLPPSPTPLQVKNTSAEDENQLLLLLATALPQPQETEGALLHEAHSAGSAFNECGQIE